MAAAGSLALGLVLYWVLKTDAGVDGVIRRDEIMSKMLLRLASG